MMFRKSGLERVIHRYRKVIRLAYRFVSVKSALDLLEDVHFLRENCVVITVGEIGDVIIGCFCRGQFLGYYVEMCWIAR